MGSEGVVRRRYRAWPLLLCSRSGSQSRLRNLLAKCRAVYLLHSPVCQLKSHVFRLRLGQGRVVSVKFSGNHLLSGSQLLSQLLRIIVGRLLCRWGKNFFVLDILGWRRLRRLLLLLSCPAKSVSWLEGLDSLHCDFILCDCACSLLVLFLSPHQVSLFQSNISWLLVHFFLLRLLLLRWQRVLGQPRRRRNCHYVLM